MINNNDVYDPQPGGNPDAGREPLADGAYNNKQQNDTASVETSQAFSSDKAVESRIFEAEQCEDETKIIPYENGFFFVDDDGVFYKRENVKTPKFICSRLDVLALTRDNESESWGYSLRWRDRDKKIHEWACPASLVSSNVSDVFAELSRRGLVISPSRKMRALLVVYVQTCQTDKRTLCVGRLGWHNGRYVLPDQTIGNGKGETVVFQNMSALEPAFSISGTVEAWRDNVATLAAGNSRPTFAVSLAFAAPLLDVANVEGGGFHLCGDSSKGKSTCQIVSASVWGEPNKYKRSWRTTANALEGLSVLHNDGLLILDEIREISPKDAGAAAYMLANGSGKSRANRAGAALRAAKWKLLFLSSGEIGLAELMRQAGERTAAGQEVRLAEIDIGDFENLHDYAMPGQLADALRENSSRYYGVAGVEFLWNLVGNRAKYAETIRECIDAFVSNPAIVPADASGQVRRVARRFALVAAAGELATVFGLTGWNKSAAIKAASACFASWLEHFGTGNREAVQILAQVRYFFELHGNSGRFAKLKATDEAEIKINNQIGFYSFLDDEKWYYVQPQVYTTEICKGYKKQTVSKMLIYAGWLEPDKAGKSSQSIHVPGQGMRRLYVFTPKVLEYIEE